MSAVNLNIGKNALWGLFALASLVPLVFFKAFVLFCLWSWFLVPLGVPPIGMALAMGINLTVNYLTYQHKTKIIGEEKITDNEDMIKNAWSFPAFVLVMGFIFSFFV